MPQIPQTHLCFIKYCSGKVSDFSFPKSTNLNKLLKLPVNINYVAFNRILYHVLGSLLSTQKKSFDISVKCFINFFFICFCKNSNKFSFLKYILTKYFTVMMNEIFLKSCQFCSFYSNLELYFNEHKTRTKRPIDYLK